MPANRIIPTIHHDIDALSDSLRKLGKPWFRAGFDTRRRQIRADAMRAVGRFGAITLNGGKSD